MANKNPAIISPADHQGEPEEIFPGPDPPGQAATSLRGGAQREKEIQNFMGELRGGPSEKRQRFL